MVVFPLLPGDQVTPKRCGHLAGKSVIGRGEMTGKIKAALDARHSPETLIIARTDAASVEGFPAAMERAKEVLPPAANMKYAEDPYHAAKDADAMLILTDWKEFAGIDFVRLNQQVRFPIVIDGRNLYKPEQMRDYGFTYVSVGRPASYQAQQGKPRSAAM